MTELADVVDAVVGGDTHRDTHALEMLAPSGTTIAVLSISNDEDGFTEAIAWIAEHAPGPRIVVGLEGTRSYGIGLARAVSAAGLTVTEIQAPGRSARRGRGKSDPIDARMAALQLLRMPAGELPVPRADGDREALRILLGARRELTVTRTRQVNRLRALLLSGDDNDRILSRGTLTDARLQAIARRRASGQTTEQTVRRAEARRLAIAVRAATAELHANKRQLAALVAALAPALLAKIGVGPVSAAQAIVSWSHRGRCRNEAAFAALAGASPLEASSGRTTRHRLNRGGDRQLNRALHDISLTRWRADPRTHAYIARRRAAGKNDPEIRRALKRYIARELFRALENTPQPLDNT
jgi:transposase